MRSATVLMTKMTKMTKRKKRKKRKKRSPTPQALPLEFRDLSRFFVESEDKF
jgi:hypothetical protein